MLGEREAAMLTVHGGWKVGFVVLAVVVQVPYLGRNRPGKARLRQQDLFNVNEIVPNKSPPMVAEIKVAYSMLVVPVPLILVLS